MITATNRICFKRGIRLPPFPFSFPFCPLGVRDFTPRPSGRSRPRPPTLSVPPLAPPIPLYSPLSSPHFLPPLPLPPRGRNAVSTRKTPPAPPLALLYPAPSPSSGYQTHEHRAPIRPLPSTCRLRSVAPTHLPPHPSIPPPRPSGRLSPPIQRGRTAPELVPPRAVTCYKGVLKLKIKIKFDSTGLD